MLVAVGLQRPNQPMSTLKTWDDMLSPSGSNGDDQLVWPASVPYANA